MSTVTLSRTSPYVSLAAVTAAIHMIPAVAMLVSDQVRWTMSDFIIAGSLIVLAGCAFIALKKRFPTRTLFIGAGIAAMFAYVWAELAVGIFFNFGS